MGWDDLVENLNLCPIDAIVINQNNIYTLVNLTMVVALQTLRREDA